MTCVTNTYNSAQVTEDALERFNELNSCLKPKWRFVMYKQSEDEQFIVPIHCEPASQNIKQEHEKLLEILPEQDPCYFAYNFVYRLENGGKRNKIAFIRWVPDGLSRESHKESARIKMLAVTNGGALKKAFKATDCSIQANTPDDLAYPKLLAAISKFERDAIDYSWEG